MASSSKPSPVAETAVHRGQEGWIWTWIFGLIIAFAIGALAGAAIACYYVESEYREYLVFNQQH
jgi:hypothetical protein